jgi:hypothetical protein
MAPGGGSVFIFFSVFNIKSVRWAVNSITAWLANNLRLVIDYSSET